MEMDKPLLFGWAEGLKNIETNIIAEARQSFIESKPDGYKPTPGEYAEFCKRYKKIQTINQRVQQEIEEDRKRLPLADQQLIEQTKPISKTELIGEPKGKREQSRTTLTIYEATDIDLNPVSWFCYGHVDLGLFAEEIKQFFGAVPAQIFHSYKVDEKRLERDDENHITRPINEFIPSDVYQPGRVEVTVAYL
jgi:hypothetical protein